MTGHTLLHLHTWSFWR